MIVGGEVVLPSEISYDESCEFGMKGFVGLGVLGGDRRVYMQYCLVKVKCRKACPDQIKSMF